MAVRPVETETAHSARLLSLEELRAQLQATGEERYHHQHPFHLLMHEGKLTRGQLQAWALNRYYYQSIIPIKDSIILSRGPDPVFRTARGSKLSSAEGYNLVAFEADHYDERTQSGWSVLVNGRAWAIYDDGEIQRLNHLGLYPWVEPEARPFWIRIRPASISGRQTPGIG